MNIVVLVKQVPDTGAERTLSQADHLLDREDADLVLDEINERATEEALSLKETADAHITVVSMGPDSALEAIRKVLAMGADRGIHHEAETARPVGTGPLRGRPGHRPHTGAGEGDRGLPARGAPHEHGSDLAGDQGAGRRNQPARFRDRRPTGLQAAW